MAFGRLERTTGPQPMGDINMTPLIDVMLVLLVIFMITAPLMTSNLKLDLPQSDAAQPSDNSPFIALGIDAKGILYLGNEPIEMGALASRLESKARDNPLLEVQLRADKSIPYGQVASLIGQVQAAGLSRIAFVAEPTDGKLSGGSALPSNSAQR
jgi:biopolymer transport protein ExbD/biopolymer transport protein TolR